MLLVALPFVLLVVGAAMLVALCAVLFAVMIPLLPFAFVAFCIWAIVRASRPALNPALARCAPSTAGLSRKAFRLPAHTEIDDPLKHGLVADPDILGRRREVLSLGNLRIWIGLDDPRVARLVQP